MMQMIEASMKHFDIVKGIVQNTIEAIYPSFYPKGAVVFFQRYHCDENIKKAIENKSVYLFKVNDEFIGTGSIEENEISRVFVLPQYQNKGYGTEILDYLEDIVFKNYSEAALDASLPAFRMYIRRGYMPVEYHKIRTYYGHYLCYHVMVKERP